MIIKIIILNDDKNQLLQKIIKIILEDEKKHTLDFYRKFSCKV